jgi:hypothetical protein
VRGGGATVDEGPQGLYRGPGEQQVGVTADG